MITYGFVKPDGTEIPIGGATHARYAHQYVSELKEKKDEEWRKERVFSYNFLGDSLDFVVRGLGWIKVGQYFKGHAKIISVPLTREDEDEKTKKYFVMKEYEQAGYYVDFISSIWWDELEQPPEKWFE